ncbi:hypothetical protein Sjap_018296 [Stephania japonica]|uniref:non-specific serine/threonine protein kinase n=1 Tax=Stephania japonica TaxID=461633 RepID=A0AAP0I8H7_9MAGN
MGNLLMLQQFLLLMILSTVDSLSASTPRLRNTSLCRINFGFVHELSWDSRLCQENTTIPSQQCCQALLSLFGVGLSQHLKETSQFHLPDLRTSTDCVDDFQAELTSLSLSRVIASTCFGSPQRFVISPRVCAGIQTKQDWIDKLGSSTQLDSSCRDDLSDSMICDACLKASLRVQNELVSIDKNTSHSTDCFYFAVLYAGGIVNLLGPESTSTAGCIFALPMLPTSASTVRHHLILVFALISAGVAVVVICFLLGLYFWWDEIANKKRESGLASGLDLEEERSPRIHLRPNTGSIWFKLDELKRATNNFSTKNLIGRGGFGIVYKGILSDGALVAVKNLIESNFQGDREFVNEVEIISNLRHRNLVSLRGCCVVNNDDYDLGEEQKQKYLVYDYMPNGNLDDHLFLSKNEKSTLSWPQRKNIILDVAKGLAYLHYGVNPAIYHRDIKATNILLDAEMRARVADFGHAKQIKEGQSHLTTRVAGTHGYLAPEYALYGQLTEKSDVYSFGMVVLEIISGRKALDLSSSDTSGPVLVTDWAWQLVKSGRIEEVLDASLLNSEDPNYTNPKGIMERFVLVGILCAHVMVALRPTILDALKMLEGDIEVPTIPDRPLPLGHLPAFSNNTTFSLSPSLSGLQVNNGVLLR